MPEVQLLSNGSHHVLIAAAGGSLSRWKDVAVACWREAVDDKLRTLAAMRAIWQEPLTTIFARQGHYALDPAVVAAQLAPDFAIERIGELADLDLSPLISRPATEARATLEIP